MEKELSCNQELGKSVQKNLIIVEGILGSGKSTTEPLIAKELQKIEKKVVCVDEGAQEHPVDYVNYDFPDFRTKRKTIFNKWRSFVESANKDKIYVFNCVYLQNPMSETMMRFGMDEEKLKDYIHEITEIIKPMNPIIICIDEPDVKDTIDSVLDERGTDWLNAVIDYHTSQSYEKLNNLSGYDGYIKCLEERRN